jgi:hypothetical protein
MVFLIDTKLGFLPTPHLAGKYGVGDLIKHVIDGDSDCSKWHPHMVLLLSAGVV